MDDQQDNQNGQALPLPDELRIDHANDLPPERQAAADLVRQKIDAAYQERQDQAAEFIEEAVSSPAEPVMITPTQSKYQQQIEKLAQSGKPLHEINDAWHEYYAGLTDAEKHEVWREFHDAKLKSSKLLPALEAEVAPKMKVQPAKPRRRPPSRIEQAVVKHSKQIARGAANRIPQRHRQPLKSLAVGLTAGFIFLLVFMFTFFNERFIAPFIQPSRNFNYAQIITAGAPVSTKPEIIIPKINVEIPVIYWVTSTDDNAVEEGLDNGVVHYADTAQPGQDGNVVIVGHSASNIFNKGRYKFAFSLLRRLENGDTFFIQKNGVRYTYQVYKKTVVKPTDVSVLGPQAGQRAVATLITCDPPGTSSNRLIVFGKQVSPDPGKNSQDASGNKVAVARTSVIPGQSRSLWSRVTHWFTGD